jgi:hypothetical protein
MQVPCFPNSWAQRSASVPFSVVTNGSFCRNVLDQEMHRIYTRVVLSTTLSYILGVHVAYIFSELREYLYMLGMDRRKRDMSLIQC